jgi:hypothetical protein
MVVMMTARGRRKGGSRVIKGGACTRRIAPEVLAKVTYERDRDGVEFIEEGGEFRAKMQPVREQE